MTFRSPVCGPRVYRINDALPEEKKPQQWVWATGRLDGVIARPVM